MPMWLYWLNPRTHRQERIFNHYLPGTPDGDAAVALAKRALGKKFGLSPERIPEFRIEAIDEPPTMEAMVGLEPDAVWLRETLASISDILESRDGAPEGRDGPSRQTRAAQPVSGSPPP